MMRWCFFIIKFTIRFLIISLLMLTILIGGYVGFLSKEKSVLNDIINPIVQTITEDIKSKDTSEISISGIKENWKITGLTINIETIDFKNKNIDFLTEQTEFKVDLIKSFIEKKLVIDNITSNNTTITVKSKNISSNKNSLEKKEDLINKYSNFIYSPLNISFNLKNIKLNIPNKKINIDKIKIKKDKNENKINISYQDKVNTFITYKINNKTKIIKSKINIKSNNFYFKKVVNLLGKSEILEYIYFDDIYKIVGDLESQVLLDIDYKNKAISDYKASIKLNGNKIILKSFEPITLTNAIGNLYYNKEYGFFSDDIIANLDKRKTILKIDQDGLDGIDFKFNTSADITKLSEIACFPLFKILKGTDSFSGIYKLRFHDVDELNVESDFQEIDYISQIKIKTDKGFKLKAFFDYESDKMNFHINQSDHTLKLNFIDGLFYNIDIGLNKSRNKNIKEKGFFVSGLLENVNVLDLFDYLKQLKNDFPIEKHGENDHPMLDSSTQIEINLLNTTIESQVFENINFLYQNKTVSLTFNEENAMGYIYFNENTKEIDFNASNLKIIKKDAESILNKKIKNSEYVKEFNYKKNLDSKYKIKINIDNLSIDENKGLKLNAAGYIDKENINIEKLILTDQDSSFKVEGLYTYDSTSNISEIKQEGDSPLIVFNNLNDFQLRFLKEKSGFEAKQVKLNGNLTWAGFKTLEMGETLSGQLILDVEKGYIPKDTIEMGFLKTLNIFNFDSWLKMFTFDFQEMEGGLHFNSIKGSVDIKNNIVTISPRIILDSDLFILEFNGEIDYIKSTYNLKIESIVPLLNKVPAIALFAGVAPEVVGVIWLVDKLAGDIINDTFTRSKFNVNGTFDNPVYTKEVEDVKEVKDVKEEIIK